MTLILNAAVMEAKLAALTNAMTEQLQEALAYFANGVLNDATALLSASSKSGELIASLYFLPQDNLSVLIGDSADYAWYFYYGHQSWPGFPFFEQPFLTNAVLLQEYVNSIVQEAMHII